MKISGAYGPFVLCFDCVAISPFIYFDVDSSKVFETCITLLID